MDSKPAIIPKGSFNNQYIDSNKQLSSPSKYSVENSNNHNNNIIMQNLQIDLSQRSFGENVDNQNDQGFCVENMVCNIDDSSGRMSISNKNVPPQDIDINHDGDNDNYNDNTRKKNSSNPVCIIELVDEAKRNSGKFKEVTFGNRSINPRQRKSVNPMASRFNNQESSRDTLMFFFINKYSGEGKGRNLLDMDVNKIEFAGNLKVTAYIFDYSDALPGIEALQMELKRTSLIKVIIGGGDGSILPFIETLNSHDIDLNRLIFGIIPLGRTNDISRQFRWGESAEITSDMAAFKLLVEKISQSPSVIIDLWEIKLTCDEHNGAIIKGSSNFQEKVPQKDKNNMKMTILRKGFVGYFSLGYDARIGFNTEKRRTDHKCWNNMIVLWEKTKKCFFTKSLPVSGFIDSFCVISMPKGGCSTNNINNADTTLRENENRKTEIFQTPNKDGLITKRQKIELDQGADSDDDNHSNTPISAFKNKEIILKGQPLGFVCQNIEYFFNGNPISWKETNNEYGLETYNPKISKDDKASLENKLNHDIEFFDNAFGKSSQSFSDRKLEFYTYNSVKDIGTSKKDKIYHGEGPFLLKFKPTPLLNDNDKFNRIYMNIDGEYYNIIKPLELRIRISKKINNGRVKFLQNI